MTNKEIIQISKMKPKKISILCTFKSTGVAQLSFSSYKVAIVSFPWKNMLTVYARSDSKRTNLWRYKKLVS
jgi:hypothetical protein